MFQSLKLGKVLGIDLYVHGTFWLLPLFIMFSGMSAGVDLATTLTDIAFVFAIFTCVGLHELGHAMAARAYGIGTRDITLYPLGGVASLERMPEKPGREIAIALAGPAVNVVIATTLLLGFVGAAYLTSWTPTEEASGIEMFLARVMVANIVLTVFNLLPCFPMDGGRVLRAVLASQLGRLRATEIAVGVGTVVALAFIGYGLYESHFGLIAVAVMVWLLGQAELAAVRFQAGAREVRARVEEWFEGPTRDAGAPVSSGFSGLAWDDARRVWVQYRDGYVVRVIDSEK